MRNIALLSAAVLLWVGLLCACAPGATLCFEAELANELRYPFEIISDRQASGKLALCIPEGSGAGGIFRGGRASATYRVPLEKAGRYSIWMRLWSNGICSDTIFISIGDEKPRTVANGVFHKWVWTKAGRWDLESGTVEISLADREDGILVDQILLTDGPTPAPDAVMSANIIPGIAGTERAEPRIHFGAASEVANWIKPSEFMLHHRPATTVPLEPLRNLILAGDDGQTLTLWLRNNSLRPASGVIEFATEASVVITPPGGIPFELKDGVPLTPVRIGVVRKPGMSRRTYPLTMRVRHKSGLMEGRMVHLTRPYQWLVSNEFACPKAGGLDTVSPVDNAAGGGFPGRLEGVSWKLAPESAVTPFGLLDMRKAVGDKTYVMAYAYTRVSSPVAGEYIVDLRHDDMMRLWVNGKVAFSGRRSAPSDCTRSMARVVLRKGDNDILVKICQRKNYWEFGLGFLTLDGKPAPVTGGDVEHILNFKGTER